MKKLLTIILFLSISAIVSAQTVTKQTCTYTPVEGGHTYKSDDMVLIQYDLLEQQIVQCERGAKVVLTSTNSTHIDFKYKSPNGKKFKVPTACRDLDKIVSAWNNTIDRLLSDDTHPIVAALTISAIRQTVENAPFTPNQEVNSWMMFRNEYPNILEIKLANNYEYDLLYKERGLALSNNETVTDKDMMDTNIKTELMAKINPLKSLDAVMSGKICDDYTNKKAKPVQGTVSNNNTPVKQNINPQVNNQTIPVNNQQNIQPVNNSPATNVDGTYKGSINGKELSIVISGSKVSSVSFAGESLDVSNPTHTDENTSAVTDIKIAVGTSEVTVSANDDNVVVVKVK